jgi:signal transduction histidine kinase
MDKKVLMEIFDIIPTGIMIADNDGSIRCANRNALEYLGIDEDGLAEINIEALTGMDSHQKKETMVRTRGDERLTIKLGTSPLADGGSVVFLTDITESHQLQQEILKMDKLASVGELTSGIAHEIRNPLAGIKTTAQALNEELPKNDHRRTYVSRIIMEIDRLNKLLLTFFDFARPRELAIHQCDLKKIIENAVYMIQDTARANKVQIIEFYPTKKAVVMADPSLIQQVLMNIFINGIQAMGNGGKMEIQLTEQEDWVKVAVTDTGKGIPENVRGKVFDPFFTTKAKGIGLGLSISYRIIKMHSGTITFESGPGGTTFRIMLPRNLKAK